MSDQRLNVPGVVVLKFGGSVLRDEGDVDRAVHEIYRWVRRGERVVAVVSALEGTTDALIARARTYSDAPESLHAGAYATLLATGEQTSAALLGLALDRAGVPVEVLDAASISLRTSGTTIDAFPESIDAAKILSTLERVSVVVLPGFIGRDAEGRTTLLGRGGSDLTALFVAERLIAAGSSGTRCRLVKDVDGLYEFDPAKACGGEKPGRYTSVHWDGALALDGGIVQHKAVRYAKEKGLEFEVGAALRDDATVVGDLETTLTDGGTAPANAPRPLRVVLLGCGTVGLGVYKRLRALGERFEFVEVAVRDVERAAAAGVEPRLLTTDVIGAASRDCDLVIETIGGTSVAYEAVRRALEAGTRVVTANKAVIASHGDELERLATRSGTSLSFSAAVGGGTPAIEAVRRIAGESEIESIEGVLNGTTNFVLGLVERGESFGAAVLRAQAAGFAEADPSRDLDGRDAGDKLCVLAREAWGVTLDPGKIERESLDEWSVSRVRAGLREDQTVRHVARVRRDGGTLLATVRPEIVERGSTLGRIEREWNAIVVRRARGPDEVVIGRGAGRWPTSESVVADMIAPFDRGSAQSGSGAIGAQVVGV
jgi:homoserine dehydrogenase